ncbi:MAG: leucine-rich repeat protein [Sodaliphilus sp.]
MKKFFLSTFCALIALCASALSIGDSFSVDDLTYVFKTNGARGSAYPGVWVTGLSDAGKAKSALSLYIPTTIIYNGSTYRVTQIDMQAFADATNLTGATIGYGITDIGVWAFQNCTNLEFVRIPSSISNISGGAFMGCSALKIVYIANPIPSTFTTSTNAFPSNSDMHLYVPKTIMGSDYYYSNSPEYSKFSSIERSSNVFDFGVEGEKLFCVTKAPTLSSPGEISLVNLNRNETGNYTFEASYSVDGYNYKFVSVADSACCYYTKEEGEGWYHHVNYIKSLDFSNATNLISIYADAFRNCAGLANVNLGSTVERIVQYAFAETDLTSITIPKSVTFFSGDALLNCQKLTSIVVEDGNAKYKSMGGILYEAIDEQPQSLRLLHCPYAYPNEALYEYMFPKNLIEIGRDALFSCRKVRTIRLPYGVKSLGIAAFPFHSMDEVKIPSSVTDINERAFVRTTIKKLYINLPEPPVLKDFSESHDTTGFSSTQLFVPYGAVSKYQAADYWKDCASIQEGSYDVGAVCTKAATGSTLSSVRSGFTISSTEPTTINGTTYDGTMKLTHQQAPSQEATLQIPASVTYDSKNYAVTSIDGKVMVDDMTSPLSIELGDNVETIGDYAFYNQSNISGLKLNKNLKEIGAYSLFKCGIAGELYLPYGLKRIGINSLIGNKITTIQIPSSVESIGSNALGWNTLLSKIYLNNAWAANITSWVLTDVPTSCTLYVPTGQVQQYKNNSKWGTLNVKAGAYDFAYGDKPNSIYHLTVTDTNPVEADGVTYDGKAKYVYGPQIASSTTNVFTADRYESYNNKKYLITEFGDSLLHGASQMDVRLRNNPLIERIGAYAFYNSGVTSFDVPASCTEIGRWAFVNAQKLKELVLLSEASFPSFSSDFYGLNASGFTCYVPWGLYARYKSSIKSWIPFSADSGTPLERLNAFFKSANTAEAICIDHPVDWDASGMEAYTVNQVNISAKIANTHKESATPAGTGLLVKGYKKGDIYKLVRFADTPTIDNNLLVGVTSSVLTNVKNVSVGYIFDVPTLTFIRPTSDVYAGAGSAYLKLGSNLLRYPSSLTVSGFEVEALIGDVNGDGVVNVSDVTALVNRILGDTTYDDSVCDVNADGVVNVSDVTALVNLILG